ncbi:AbrB/MazE/SpoVT family DNA-binding domain-containing protein [Alicyclobacillus mengziensis]|uniref:AbrB/MazE/SpoVT family DNA-binding domain-containing protein n=1 Tax=Alicyclobacillus mengziensis TaxID=2931921 RepID=A0A9X7VUV5_9BACL|nr:AbrB/MazE/SpoVT family DNA-binding domain-containing protein [Alicyclobacillus mengziensis]QSO45591.1 AbrB/MazE/SpoVT family DNA-binding domain-containing protein [Alicyclobacillus mengziensis]
MKRHHGHTNGSGLHHKPNVFGTTKVGERGQIVIPKDAREQYNINPGDTLFVIGDEGKRGLAIVKADFLEGFALQILRGIGYFDSKGNQGEELQGENEENEK